jgi:hypothetical protein
LPPKACIVRFGGAQHAVGGPDRKFDVGHRQNLALDLLAGHFCRQAQGLHQVRTLDWRELQVAHLHIARAGVHARAFLAIAVDKREVGRDTSVDGSSGNTVAPGADPPTFNLPSRSRSSEMLTCSQPDVRDPHLPAQQRHQLDIERGLAHLSEIGVVAADAHVVERQRHTWKKFQSERAADADLHAERIRGGGLDLRFGMRAPRQQHDRRRQRGGRQQRRYRVQRQLQ